MSNVTLYYENLRKNIVNVFGLVLRIKPTSRRNNGFLMSSSKQIKQNSTTNFRLVLEQFFARFSLYTVHGHRFSLPLFSTVINTFPNCCRTKHRRNLNVGSEVVWYSQRLLYCYGHSDSRDVPRDTPTDPKMFVPFFNGTFLPQCTSTKRIRRHSSRQYNYRLCATGTHNTVTISVPPEQQTLKWYFHLTLIRAFMI
jgi:hypothetical protein